VLVDIGSQAMCRALHRIGMRRDFMGVWNVLFFYGVCMGTSDTPTSC